MSPIWKNSAHKHNISKQDIAYAIANYNYSDELEETKDGGKVILYIGHPHAQTEREIEVLVTVYPDGREAVIFHAMPLRSLFDTHRQEKK